MSMSAPFQVAALILQSAHPGAGDLDDLIVASAKNSYNFNTCLKGDRINVVSKRGAVTLTGRVQNDFHRALAEETLAGLPGVRRVNNQLSVLDPPGRQEPNRALEGRVQAALQLNRELGPLPIQVQARDGVVTLAGAVDTRLRKRKAEAYVKGLDGVVRVVNELQVVGSAPSRTRELQARIDDASISAQVKLALLFHRATRSLRTRVRTDRGTVTLEGVARNPQERDQATRIARRIEGVKAVRNRMTVEKDGKPISNK
jgi:osmotically-inducible protein OsmY